MSYLIDFPECWTDGAVAMTKALNGWTGFSRMVAVWVRRMNEWRGTPTPQRVHHTTPHQRGTPTPQQAAVCACMHHAFKHYTTPERHTYTTACVPYYTTMQCYHIWEAHLHHSRLLRVHHKFLEPQFDRSTFWYRCTTVQYVPQYFHTPPQLIYCTMHHDAVCSTIVS